MVLHEMLEKVRRTGLYARVLDYITGGEYSRLKTQVQELDKELDAREQEIKRQGREAAEFAEDRRRYHTTIGQLEASVSGLQADNARKDEEIVDYRGENERLVQENAVLRASGKEQAGLIGHLKKSYKIGIYDTMKSLVDDAGEEADDD